MNLKRFFQHVRTGPWTVKSYFSVQDLTEIESLIKSAEASHGGDIRFCVETDLTIAELFAGLSSAERARQVFAELGVWNTEGNNGVLLYVLLADRKFEIVADRAISRLVPNEEIEAACREIEAEFRAGRFLAGVKLGVERISMYTKRCNALNLTYPPELADKPVIL